MKQLIKEKINLLKDFLVWGQMTPEEKTRVRTADTDLLLDQIARSMLDKYL